MNIDMAALHAIEADKGISVDVVVDTIKSALLTAYRHTEGHEADARIDLWLMSCRVLGYQIEQAVMATIIDIIAGGATVEGTLIETEVNFPCRSLFASCGFERDGTHIVTDENGIAAKAGEPFDDVVGIGNAAAQ